MPKALLCDDDDDACVTLMSTNDHTPSMTATKSGVPEQAADRIEERHLHDHERRASETALIAPLLESLVTRSVGSIVGYGSRDVDRCVAGVLHCVLEHTPLMCACTVVPRSRSLIHS